MVYWEISTAALWIVVLLLLVYLVALTRQVGVLHLRIQPVGARTTNAGLDIGEYAPLHVLTDTQRRPVHLRDATRATVLLFLSTNCPACRTLGEALPSFTADLGEQIVLVFGAIDPVEVEAFLREHKIRNVPVVISPEVVTAFRVSGVPYGFAIDHSGKIQGKGIVNTAEHVESLVNTMRYMTPTVQQLVVAQEQSGFVLRERRDGLERGLADESQG